jgi:hypothetical protein
VHTASIITSETQVYSSKTTWYYIPEGCHLHTRCHENLKISNDHVLRASDQPGGGQPQHGWLQHTQIVALSVGLFILPQGQNNTVEEGTNFTAKSSIRQGGLCKVTTPAASSAVSLPDRPVQPSIQQNTKDFLAF